MRSKDTVANQKKCFEESFAFVRRYAQIIGFFVFSFMLVLLYDYGINDWIDSHTHGYFGRVLAWIGTVAISGVVGNATFALIVWFFKQREVKRAPGHLA